ncbi:uncharacterized protein LOC135313189 isoform X2 [Phalacrocorax carbo]|uniref:uncharacterized protein LOC135313189 isoform X2 n=1 Tax=Phalacrocorax carbo TaxID=9209 RepID=UPI00311A30BD
MLKPVWRGLGHNGCTGAAGASGGVGGTGDVRVAVPTPGEGSSRRLDEERSPEAASAGEHRSQRTCRVRSSSWLFQVSFGSGFSGPAHGWLGLISAPVHCGSSSAAASGPAPGCSWSVLALVSGASYGWLRLSSAPVHCSASSAAASGPAHQRLQLVFASLEGTTLTKETPASFRRRLFLALVWAHRLCLQLLSSVAPATSSLCLLKCSWLFAKVVNQSLSQVLYEYELS